MDEYINFSYAFDGKGNSSQLEGLEISSQIRAHDLAWVDLDANHPKTAAWLESELNYLDTFIINALLEEETRPRIRQVGDGILLILRAVNSNDVSHPEDMVSIRLWIDANRIISLRKKPLKAITDITKQIDHKLSPKNSGDFLCDLLQLLLTRMDPVIAELHEAADNSEEDLISNIEKETVTDIRKKAIIFKRYMSPQRDALNYLRSIELSWLTSNHKNLIQERCNQLTRFIEDLDALRERAQILKDELSNIMTAKLNKNMYILSIISATFLPLGFLTGLLGVNIGGIPGTNNPEAFYLFCGLLIFAISVQIFVFKFFKWL